MPINETGENFVDEPEESTDNDGFDNELVGTETSNEDVEPDFEESPEEAPEDENVEEEGVEEEEGDSEPPEGIGEGETPGPITLTQEELDERVRQEIDRRNTEWVEQQRAAQQQQQQSQGQGAQQQQQAPIYEFVTENEFDEALTDRVAMNRMLNKVFYFGLNQAMQQIAPVVQQSTEQRIAASRAEEEFYLNNSDLRGHEVVVNSIAQHMMQSGQTQGRPLGEVFREVEAEARRQLNLPRPRTAPTGNVVRRGQSLKKHQKPNPGLAGGTAGRAGAPKGPTGLDAEIAEMLED